MSKTYQMRAATLQDKTEFRLGELMLPTLDGSYQRIKGIAFDPCNIPGFYFLVITGNAEMIVDGLLTEGQPFERRFMVSPATVVVEMGIGEDKPDLEVPSASGQLVVPGRGGA